MGDTYFIRIKKEYAADIIEDLQKMDAVEFINEENISIPQWQIDKVLEAKKKAKDNPSLLIDWETVKQNIRRR
ncbi:hypothetical protein [Ferruginibacter sp.]|nr:hypothetical protein [Ferruginibacter sp.]